MSTAQRQTKAIKRQPLRAPAAPNYRLRELRRNRGWSIEYLAAVAGNLSHTTVRNIEEGRTREPQTRTMYLLAGALDTTIADLESGVAKGAV